MGGPGSQELSWMAGYVSEDSASREFFLGKPGKENDNLIALREMNYKAAEEEEHSN